MMKLAWMLIFLVCLACYGQDESKEIKNASNTELFKKAALLFSEGKYKSTVEELNNIEKILISNGKTDKATLGLLAYWKGIASNRNRDYPTSLASFSRALELGYVPLDIHYEYGQALYAAEKMTEARLQFKESVNRKFKRGVSLYYIAFISKEMGERKKAYTFFKAVSKLGPEESKDVLQASEMQIGDIYLEQVEKHPDAFRAVENYVIPQYEKALKINKDSPLSSAIQEKIVNLQRKYDLVLFRLRNGKPTQIPPYFLRLAEEVGYDSNVVATPTETTVSKSKQASSYSKTEAYGKYTFYIEDYFSIAPELRFNYTRYFNRVPEVYKNDNYMVAPAVRTAYEHTYRKKPAAFLFDYDYNEMKRDSEAEKKLEFNSRSHSFMAGENFNFFASGDTTIRLRYRLFESYQSSSDSKSSGFSLEQVAGAGAITYLFLLSHDRTRVEEKSFDTNSWTFRTDVIFPKVGELFTPSTGLSLTSTDPINDRSTRGRELTINPSARFSRSLGKNWKGNLRLDYTKNNSKDKASFAYKKWLSAFELEYLF